MVNISNDRLIIQNALLNHADDDIKKEMDAKLDLEIKLLSEKFTTGDKENGKEKSSRKKIWIRYCSSVVIYCVRRVTQAHSLKSAI